MTKTYSDWDYLQEKFDEYVKKWEAAAPEREKYYEELEERVEKIMAELHSDESFMKKVREKEELEKNNPKEYYKRHKGQRVKRLED